MPRVAWLSAEPRSIPSQGKSDHPSVCIYTERGDGERERRWREREEEEEREKIDREARGGGGGGGDK